MSFSRPGKHQPVQTWGWREERAGLQEWQPQPDLVQARYTTSLKHLWTHLLLNGQETNSKFKMMNQYQREVKRWTPMQWYRFQSLMPWKVKGISLSLAFHALVNSWFQCFLCTVAFPFSFKLLKKQENSDEVTGVTRGSGGVQQSRKTKPETSLQFDMCFWCCHCTCSSPMIQNLGAAWCSLQPHCSLHPAFWMPRPFPSVTNSVHLQLPRGRNWFFFGIFTFRRVLVKIVRHVNSLGKSWQPKHEGISRASC